MNWISTHRGELTTNTSSASYAGRFLLGCKQEFFFCKFFPRKAETSSRIFSEWVLTTLGQVPDQFSDAGESQLRECRTSSFFNGIWTKWGLYLISKKKNDEKIEIWTKYGKSGIIVIATLEKRETDLGTSPRVVKLIPRRIFSIFPIYGAKKKKKTASYVCNLKKKKNA